MDYDRPVLIAEIREHIKLNPNYDVGKTVKQYNLKPHDATQIWYEAKSKVGIEMAVQKRVNDRRK